MNLVEFIGFLLAFSTMMFLFFRKVVEDRRRRRDPESYEREEVEKQRALKETLRAMNLDLEEDEEEEPIPIAPPAPPKTHRIVKDNYKTESRLANYQTHPAIESRRLKNPIEERERDPYRLAVSEDMITSPSYETPPLFAESRASELLRKLASKKELVIFHEILSKPRALNPHDPYRR